MVNYKIVEVEVQWCSEEASMFTYPPSWMWRHLVMLYLILKSAQNGSFWISSKIKVFSMKIWYFVQQTVLFNLYWCSISLATYLEYNLDLFYKILSGSANFLCHGATVCPISAGSTFCRRLWFFLEKLWAINWFIDLDSCVIRSKPAATICWILWARSMSW